MDREREREREERERVRDSNRSDEGGWERARNGNIDSIRDSFLYMRNMSIIVSGSPHVLRRCKVKVEGV